MNDIKTYNGYNPFLRFLKSKETYTPFEQEYINRNLNYIGYPFANIKLTIGEKTVKYVKEHFKTDKEVTEITIDYLWGETKDVYHVGYKKHNFFLYKEDTENPFDKEINCIPFDESKYSNKLGQKLFDFQIEGVKFLKKNNPAFSWDDMGLGKTRTAILAALDGGFKKILVVCLASLKTNWRREIENYNQSVKIIYGSEWDDSKTTFTVINYEIIKNFIRSKRAKDQTGTNQLLYENYDCIILDEVHRAKNPKSIQANCLQMLTKGKKIIGLSGTPFEKNIDFFNICRVLNVKVTDLVLNSTWFEDNIENYKNYALRYCNAYEQVLDSPKSKKEKEMILEILNSECKKFQYIKSLLNILEQYGNLKVKRWYFEFNKEKKYFDEIKLEDCKQIWKAKGQFPEKRKKVMILGRFQDGKKIENTNSIELNQRIKHLQIRRTKKDVLHNFPDKFIYPLYFELTTNERGVYRDLWKEYMEKKNEKKYTDEELEKMAESIKIREFLAKIKVAHTINFAENKIEDGYKVIIFTHFKEEYQLILEALGKQAVGINASMSGEKKQTLIDKFQTDEKIRAIVGNIKTLGTGHNLTKGDIVINNSPDWNSGEHDQSEDRAFRIGRDEDVTVYYCLFEGTHEEEVYQRSIQKKENKEILLNQK